jgi:hypothetical protein
MVNQSNLPSGLEDNAMMRGKSSIMPFFGLHILTRDRTRK